MTNEAKWPTQAEVFNAFERAAKAKGNPLAGAQAVADLCLDCANVPYKLDQRAAWIDGLEAALSLTQKELGDGFKAERAIEAKIKDVRESMAHLRPAERGSPTLKDCETEFWRAFNLRAGTAPEANTRAIAAVRALCLQSQPVPTSASGKSAEIMAERDAKYGPCCMGAVPSCAAGCAVEEAARRDRHSVVGVEDVVSALLRVTPFRNGSETGTTGLVRRADVEQVMRALFVASNATMEECVEAFTMARDGCAESIDDGWTKDECDRAGIAAVRSLFVASNASGGMA